MSRMIWTALACAGCCPALAFADGTPLHFKADDAAEVPWSAVAVLGLVVLALLWLLTVLKRRRGSSGGLGRVLRWLPDAAADDAITVLATRQLGARTALHVVQWEGGKVFIAVNEHQVVRLGERSAETADAVDYSDATGQPRP